MFDMLSRFAVVRPPAEAGVGGSSGPDADLVSRSGVVEGGCAEEGEGWRCGEAGAEDLQ
jgi:hypothetical protein